MADIDKTEGMLDAELHSTARDALVTTLDALAPFNRDDRMRIMSCVRLFFELPRSE